MKKGPSLCAKSHTIIIVLDVVLDTIFHVLSTTALSQCFTVLARCENVPNITRACNL
jgi:hypothetical protein